MYKSVVKPTPFCYAITPVTALAAAGSVQPNFNISNDADFIMTELRAVIVKAAKFDGNILMQIKLASGELYSNGGIDMLSFASTYTDVQSESGKPIYFPSIKFPMNSTIEVSITNNNTAEVLSIQLQLWGYKPTEGC